MLFVTLRRALQMISFIYFSIVVDSQEVCNETITGCCPGYFWNYRKNTCEPCMPGYHGINCTFICPYPSYGHGCQGLCDCNEDMCDVSNGCQPIATECLPGYVGVNFVTKCPYPTYGEKCQGTCDCSKDACDVSTGCRKTNTRTTGIHFKLTILRLCYK
nr:platelet endothelial aggregation receptor 1-like [Crassostrea gigas]